MPISLTRTQWVERIGGVWDVSAQEAIGAWLQIGRDLIAAKDDLEHGEFLAMIEQDLPFGKRSAQMLMKIASDQRISHTNRNTNHGALLPASWRTLYELTRLEDAEFDQLIADGVIRPDMERKEVNKVRRQAAVAADEVRVLNLVPVVGKFRTLVIDPAWESIEVTVAQVRTSNEQWQKNPDQMLFYAGSRMWARRYTPDLVLGIMFDDEAEAVEAPKPTLQNLLAIQKPAEKELIDPTTGEVVEHVDPIKIEMNEGSSWGQFIEPLQRYIASARSIDEVDQWMMLNQDLLLKLREAKPQLYKLFEKNIEPTKERLANQ